MFVYRCLYFVPVLQAIKLTDLKRQACLWAKLKNKTGILARSELLFSKQILNKTVTFGKVGNRLKKH
ncbi:hypothetical protein BM525_08630 [Alteromonas mediterranea]|nr:hypothetical protein BM525_08630 [Alteromonas mediterranea]